MDDDLDDYKLDTTFYPKSNYVVHTSWTQDRARGLRKVKVEDRWYRKQGIGMGSSGSVHLEAMENGEQRAVKKISKALAAEIGIDYRKELAALSLFSRSKFRQHQIFVEFLGWFEDNDTVFLAMEFFPKSDLGKYLNGEIREKDAKVISRQMLEGLKILHDKGFTHRDIKPQWIKIGDFGISKRIRSDAFTQLRTEIGTPGYEAPEVRDRESSSYTNAIDIWSFGCVVYQLMALNLPFLSRIARQKFCDGEAPFPDRPLKGKMSGEGIEFLRSILEPNPPLRPTAGAALKTTWLSPVEFIVGMNIGIDYCAVSWEALSNTENIKVVTSWPSAGNTVPSTISYFNGKVKKWGHTIALEDENLNAFTIFLSPIGSDNATKMQIRRYNSLLERLQKTSQDLVTDYIANLWQYTMADIHRRAGLDEVHAYIIKTIIIMPDASSDYAKDMVLKAATKAGMPDNIVTLRKSQFIAEWYFESEENRYWTDDTCIICEATKRTVSVTSYTVEQSSPLKLRETVPCAVDDLCGSDFIDIEFENYIKTLVGQDEYNSLSIKSRSDMMLAFANLKKDFKAADMDQFVIHLFGVNDNPKNGIINNTIRLERTDLEKTFGGVLLRIKKVIFKQISEVKKKGHNIEGILFFGNFEPYPYYTHCAASWFGEDKIDVRRATEPLTILSEKATFIGLRGVDD